MVRSAPSRVVTPVLVAGAIAALIGIGVLQKRADLDREETEVAAETAAELGEQEPTSDTEGDTTEDPVPVETDTAPAAPPEPDVEPEPETADAQTERPAGGGDATPTGVPVVGGTSAGTVPAPPPPPADRPPPDAPAGEPVVVAGGAIGVRSVTQAPSPPLREFSLRYKEGFSFREQAVVPPDEADLVFVATAGRIGSVEIHSPAGITNVRTALEIDDNHADALAIYQRLRGVSPSSVELHDRVAGRRFHPAADVFIVRVAGGGWAKVLLAERGFVRTDWTKSQVTFRYEYLPRGSRFQPPARMPVEEAGLVFEGHVPVASPRPASARRRVAAGPTIGNLPARLESQELLFCRARHGDAAYQYSLAYGSRDNRPYNSRSLSYGLGGLYVRSVTDHRSALTEIEPLTWTQVARGPRFPQRLARESVAPVHGGLYFIQTRDSLHHFDTLLRVTGLAPGDCVAFEWITLDRGKFRRSPSFSATKAEIKGIEGQLTRLSRGGRQFDERRMPTGAPADAYMRLAISPSTVGLDDARSLGQAINLLVKAGHETVLGEGLVESLRASPVHVRGDVANTAEVLDALTRQLGLGWDLDPTGRVVIVRPKQQ